MNEHGQTTFSPTIMLAWAKNLNVTGLHKILVLRVA